MERAINRSGRAFPLVMATVVTVAFGVHGSEKYKIDPLHSAAQFRINHLGFSFAYGRFNQLSGSFTYDEKDPAKCSIQMEVRAESVDTNSKERDEVLRKPDFFNVKKHPVASFKSTSVKRVDENHLDVTGDFSLLGVTKSITVRAQHIGAGKGKFGKYRRGFDAVFTIKRGDFGMKARLPKLGNEVRITIAVEGTREP